MEELIRLHGGIFRVNSAWDESLIALVVPRGCPHDDEFPTGYGIPVGSELDQRRVGLRLQQCRTEAVAEL